MDHLPYPKYAFLPPIEIPYICSTLDDFDGFDFLEYPIRRGWSRPAQSLEWTDCSLNEVVQRAQSWLYFGLLHAILGDVYRKEAFIRSKSNGHFFLDTRCLKEHLASWASFTHRKDLKESAQKRSRPKNSFENFDGVFKEVDRQSDILDEKPQCQIITCGIKILLLTIQEVVINFDHRKNASIYQFNLVPPRILIGRMVEGGWCPHQICILFPRSSGKLVYYLSALSRTSMNVNHQSCTKSSCTAHNVDITNYTVRHVQENCNCEFHGPDINKVAEIIRGGHIPIMSLVVRQDGSPSIEIIKGERGVEYTAISHVWSGGLGGISSNNLPSCQLLQLYDCLQKLDRYRGNEHIPGGWFARLHIPYIKKGIYIGLRGTPRWARLELCSRETQNRLKFFSRRKQNSVNFWMDTLCIPVGAENASLRSKSIQMMDLIYAGAQSCLVLDPELQRIKMKGLPEEQLNVHVQCSAWMTRCWTLQEARLSREWYAQFADGIYDPIRARALASIEDERAEIKANGDNAVSMLSSSMTWFHSMLPMQRTTVFLNPKEEELFDVEIFQWAWNCLSDRSTTKPEDVLGIFANLLSLSAGEVVALPYEERLKAIIRAHQTIPTALLYNSDVKIKDRHNRWIPLTIGHEHLRGLYGEIRITPDQMILDNLVATPVGFLVAPSAPRLDKFCLVDPISSETLWVRLAYDGADVEFQCSSSIATCYVMGDLKASTLDKNSGKDWQGARFSVQKEEGSTLYLKYEYSLIYRHQDPLHQNDIDFVYPIIEAQRTTNDKIFRIDCGKLSVA